PHGTAGGPERTAGRAPAGRRAGVGRPPGVTCGHAEGSRGAGWCPGRPGSDGARDRTGRRPGPVRAAGQPRSLILLTAATPSAARAIWISHSTQSTPLVSATPSPEAMPVPMNAATMPIRMVHRTPMRCRPGTTSRPSTPITMPMTIALMTPEISMSGLSPLGRWCHTGARSAARQSRSRRPVRVWRAGGTVRTAGYRSDVDAEVGGDARQSGRVALSDGAELPLGAVPVELAEDHGRLGGRVLRQVVARDLGAAGLVHDPDEGVAHLAEALAAVLGVVDGDGEDDPLDRGRHTGQVHLDRLVVALALTGEVVAGVLDRTVRAAQVVVEDEVLVRRHLAGGVEEQRGGVQVVVRTGRGADVPAQTDQDRGQARRFLAQRDIAALGQGDSHGVTPSRRAWSRRGARPRASNL